MQSSTTSPNFTIDVSTGQNRYVIVGEILNKGISTSLSSIERLPTEPLLTMVLMKYTSGGGVQELHRCEEINATLYLDYPTRETVFGMLTYQVLLGMTTHSTRHDLRIQALQACLELRNTLRINPRTSVDVTQQRNGIDDLLAFAGMHLNKFYPAGQFTCLASGKHPEWSVWCKRQFRKGADGLEVVSRWTFVRPGELRLGEAPVIQLEHKKTMTFINAPLDMFDNIVRVRGLFSCYVE